MRILAIIPARGGSKRIPNKNIKEFCGRPLISWTVDFARSVDYIDHIHVSTDCPDVRSVVESMNLEVPFLRSAATSNDTATTASAVIETLDRLAEIGQYFDIVALLQPTTPWRRKARWIEATNLLSSTECDTVVSVAPLRHHPWHALTLGESGEIKYFFDEQRRQARSQDTPAAYSLNGSIYISRASVIKSSKSMIGGDCRAVVCSDQVESIDIDQPEDWAEAETALEHLLKSPI